MKVISIEQRKLAVISQLLNTSDAKVISKVEELLSESLDATYHVSEQDLKYRAARALHDIATGNVVSQEDAERESKDW